MESRLELGPLRRTDRARLAGLLAATRAFHADEIDVALALFDLAHAARATERDAVPLDYEFIGARREERLVGYACFGPTPCTDGTFDLYWLAVDPAAQRGGIGRALVAHVRRELLDRGARLLVVETSSRADYANTRQFYARGGFVETARVRDFYAPADDRIMLTTRLTAQERGAATR